MAANHRTTNNRSLITLLLYLMLVSVNVEASVIRTGCGNASTDFGVGCSLNELTSGGTINVNTVLFDSWQVAEKEPGGLNLDASVIQVVPYVSHDLFGFLLQDHGNTLKVGNPTVLQFVSQDITFRITDKSGPSLIFGFYEFVLGVSYGEMRESDAPPGYRSASASVLAELNGNKGYGFGLLQCTLDTPPFPGSDCSTPISITEIIDYPVMKEAKFDKVMDVSLWTRAFAFPGGSAEIDQVLFGVRTIPEPTTIALVLAGLSMFFFPLKSRTPIVVNG